MRETVVPQDHCGADKSKTKRGKYSDFRIRQLLFISLGMFQINSHHSRQITSLVENHRKTQDSEEAACFTKENGEAILPFYRIFNNNNDLASALTKGQYSAPFKKLVLRFVFEADS